MSQQLYDFGMVGLGVMGRNFLLNVADNGFSVAGLDTNKEQAKALEEEADGKPAKGTTDMKEFRFIKVCRRRRSDYRRR